MTTTRSRFIAQGNKLWILLVAWLAVSGPVGAVEWVGAVGDFNVGSNWQGGSVPEFDQEALINNSGTAQLTGDAEIQALRLGLDGGEGTFEQSDGLLTSTGAFIGDNSTGKATISGGEFAIGNDSIHVGWREGGVGELNIGGADALVTSGDDFQLGREGTGTLNFSDGQLRAGYTVIGKFGTGVWNQTGGFFDQDFGDVEIGDGGTSDQGGTAGPRVGTVNLSGGFLQTSGHLAIGNRRGTGTVNVSGGTLMVTGGDDSTIFIGRGMDNGPGQGGATALRITGGDSTVVATGSLLMNPEQVSTSSTLIAEITGTEHTPILVSGDADVSNGTLKVELNGYTPKADDSWLLVQSGVELEGILDQIDSEIDAAGYEIPVHGFPVLLGEVLGPFADTDFSAASLPAGLSWDVSYTADSIFLSVTGTAGLLGDFNQDGVLDAADIDELTRQSASGDNNLNYDVNADNLVNDGDVTVWAKDLFKTWIGDANLDGEFNSGDLVVVLSAGDYETGNAAVWSSGDFNGDGLADSSDLVAALSDGGYELGPVAAVSAVPEPNTGVLLLLALTIAGYCHRRRTGV